MRTEKEIKIDKASGKELLKLLNIKTTCMYCGEETKGNFSILNKQGVVCRSPICIAKYYEEWEVKKGVLNDKR